MPSAHRGQLYQYDLWPAAEYHDVMVTHNGTIGTNLGCHCSLTEAFGFFVSIVVASEVGITLRPPVAEYQ